jgi:hypothetical protein
MTWHVDALSLSDHSRLRRNVYDCNNITFRNYHHSNLTIKSHKIIKLKNNFNTICDGLLTMAYFGLFKGLINKLK